jgi:ubiquinone/menaquinone biosynthesis C-methylase UbiE
MHAPPAHGLTAYRNSDTLRHNDMGAGLLIQPDGTTSPLRPSLFQRVAAGLYDQFTARLEQEALGAHRRRVLQQAHGHVLDVGAGTAANLPHYPSTVEHVVLLDPHPGMLARAAARAASLHVSATVRLGTAEHLAFADAAFDTVVCTLSLCTVKDVPAALTEAARVLRQAGRLLVLEHVRSEYPGLARWQDRLAPLQRLFSNGCNPHRDTLSAIRQAGFDFDWLDQFDEPRMPLPIVRPLLLGCATLRP